MNWHPAEAADRHAGEVDLICAWSAVVLVLEVKSTFLRQSQRDAWLHGTTTLRKAGRQLRRKVPAVQRALAVESDLARMLGLEGGASGLSIYGWIGTTATLGFIVVYIVVSIAAPVFLYRRKELRWTNVALSLAAVVLQGVALVGAVYPLPEAPNSYPIYAFLALLGVGVVIGLLSKAVVRGRIKDDLADIQGRFQKAPVVENKLA